MHVHLMMSKRSSNALQFIHGGYHHHLCVPAPLFDPLLLHNIAIHSIVAIDIVVDS